MNLKYRFLHIILTERCEEEFSWGVMGKKIEIKYKIIVILVLEW